MNTKTNKKTLQISGGAMSKAEYDEMLKEIIADKKIQKETKNLFLEQIGLKIVPPFVLTMDHLRLLSLSGNKISSLDDQLCHFGNLWDLFLDNNELSVINPLIGNLSKLKKLDLSKNNLSSLPDSMKNLASLKFLHLEDNPFQSIPKVIKEIDSLIKVFLPKSIKDAPPEFGKFHLVTKRHSDYSDDYYCYIK